MSNILQQHWVRTRYTRHYAEIQRSSNTPEKNTEINYVFTYNGIKYGNTGSILCLFDTGFYVAQTGLKLKLAI